MPFGLQPDNRFILRRFMVFGMAGIIAQNGPKHAIEITRPLDVRYTKVAPFALDIVPTVADRLGFMAVNNNSRGGILRTEDSIFAGYGMLDAADGSLTTEGE